MPTTNKRINITVPEPLYNRIQAYKEKNGIGSDAAACIQLIKRQLDGLEEAEMMMQLVSKYSLDELKQLSDFGLGAIKEMSNLRKVNHE